MTGEDDRTLIILKPDALDRGLVGECLSRIEDDGLQITRLETVDADRDLIEAHYHEHRDKDWYDALVDWMTDTVIVGIVEGENAAERVDALAGATEPVSADRGTIRGDLGDDSYDRADRDGRPLHNLIHTAEPEDAEDELKLWYSAVTITVSGPGVEFEPVELGLPLDIPLNATIRDVKRELGVEDIYTPKLKKEDGELWPVDYEAAVLEMMDPGDELAFEFSDSFLEGAIRRDQNR